MQPHTMKNMKTDTIKAMCVTAWFIISTMFAPVVTRAFMNYFSVQMVVYKDGTQDYPHIYTALSVFIFILNLVLVFTAWRTVILKNERHNNF